MLPRSATLAGLGSAVLLLTTCTENVTDPGTTNPQSVSVLTQHNDNTRAGWNDHETALTTSNVNVQQFGKVFTLTVDGEVYAQPLVVGRVAIGGGHNIVYVATVNNTVYAFDGVSGSGDGSVNGTIPFDAQKQNQRQGLTLLGGVVYVSFSSHCDWGPYHGWILGYDATTLQQQVVYNDTPNGYAGGMWESGAGMAADAGNLYVVTGNGTVGDGGDPTSPTNRGESALKLTPAGSTLGVTSYFTPYNFQFLNDNDVDYGTGGAFLIPNSGYFLTAGKDGNLYLLDKDAMGGFQPSSNQVQQVVVLNGSANMHCQPAYYKGSATEFIYVWSENDPWRATVRARTRNSQRRRSPTDTCTCRRSPTVSSSTDCSNSKSRMTTASAQMEARPATIR